MRSLQALPAFAFAFALALLAAPACGDDDDHDHDHDAHPAHDAGTDKPTTKPDASADQPDAGGSVSAGKLARPALPRPPRNGLPAELRPPR